MCCKSTLYGPATAKSRGDSSGRYPSPLSPPSNAVCYSIERQFMICTGVAVLLLPRCPAAVFWRVMAVIVYTIERVMRRPCAHVGIEGCEIFPTFANRYASATIACVTPGVRIGAARMHRCPSNEFAGDATLQSMPVTNRAFPLSASTTLVSSKANHGDLHLAATIAAASPNDTVAPARVERPDRNKKARPLARNINGRMLQWMLLRNSRGSLAHEATTTARRAGIEIVGRNERRLPTRTGAFPKRLRSRANSLTAGSPRHDEPTEILVFKVRSHTSILTLTGIALKCFPRVELEAAP